MSSTNKHFQASTGSPILVIRKLVGFVLSLAFIIGASILLFQNDIELEDIQLNVPAPPDLYLSALKGSLTYKEHQESQVIRLSEGETLRTGFFYVTGPDSVALLRSSTQELELTLRPNSTILVGSRIDPSTVQLIKGDFHIRSRGEKGNRVKIDLGGIYVELSLTCVAEVSQSLKEKRIKILRGAADLITEDDQYLIEAGEEGIYEDEEFDLNKGLFLESPRLYSPIGGMIKRKNAAQPLPVTLKWEEIGEASAYVVEVANDILFEDVLLKRTVNDTRLTLADVREGMYYWRVTSLKGRKDRSDNSMPAIFFVQLMANPEDERVSAPKLRITEASAQSSLVSIQGQTEPGAKVRVYLTTYGGEMVTREREILVNQAGSFRIQMDSPVRGEVKVVVEAYYRPEFLTRESTSVFVDF